MSALDSAREQRICTEFPAASETIYLNTAAEGLTGPTLERSLLRYAQAKARGSAGRDEMAATAQNTKTRLAGWLNCQPGDLAFCGSTSEAIAIVLRGLPWQPGDNLVITDLEFPGAMVGALSLARTSGITVRVVPHRDGVIEPEAIVAQIDQRTRLVILSHVSFLSGQRFDIAAIARAAHEQGSLILIDAAQSLGVVPIETSEIDFLVACPFKWLLGSHGLGVLYVNRSNEEALSRHLFGWRGVTDFLSVARLGDFTARSDASRYEGGMPAYPAIYALYDSLTLLDEFDRGWIERRVSHLAGELWRICAELGLHLLTPKQPEQRAGIVAFAHPDALAIGDALATEGVIAWRGDGRVRFSPHLYTSDADIAALPEILHRALERVATSGQPQARAD